MDRRKFLKYIGWVGAGASILQVNPALASPRHILGIPKRLFALPVGPPYPPGPYPSGPYPTTDPSAMAALLNNKYKDPLLTSVPIFPADSGTTYNIQMAQTLATVSSAFGNVTNVYAYGRSADPTTLHYPGYSFDVTSGTPITVNFTNNLPTGKHLLPLDLTVDGNTVMPTYPLAFPAGYTYQTQTMGTPVPENRAVVHLHGGDVLAGFDDGWPDWWTDPAGLVAPRTQTCQFPNSQPACTLWYHDHAMGSTRLNVHAGLAGFYIIRDAVESQLIAQNVLPPAASAYEVPLVIQDRMFDSGGQFLLPHQGSGGMINDPTVNQQMTWPSGHPYWVPEFFGDVAVVNGTAWPYMNVEQHKYRFRILNGCNARMLKLTLRIQDIYSTNTLPFHVIGTDQGFLGSAMTETSLFATPAHRYDVIVDFSKLPVGTDVYLYNDTPGPWPGGGGNVLNEIMKFHVSSAASTPDTVLPTTLTPYTRLSRPVKTRYITLNEWIDPSTNSSAGMQLGEGLPPAAGWNGHPWADPVTITPSVGTTERWMFINRTGDGHPMHLHLVRFQVLNRYYIDANQFDTTGKIVRVGPVFPILPFDMGWKDTVLVPPGDGVTTYAVTSILANFQKTGSYPYHCHIIDHEDNDMMRYFQVV